jgi:hypothetical protein
MIVHDVIFNMTAGFDIEAFDYSQEKFHVSYF